MVNMKILFVIDSLEPYGAERDLAEKLPLFRRLGVQTIVVSLRPAQVGFQEDLQRQGFDVQVLPMRGLWGRIVALRRIIQAELPDIIQTVLFHSDLAGRLAAIGTCGKVVSRLVNMDYDEVRLHDPNTSVVRFRLARLLDGLTARHLTHHIYANSHAVQVAAARDLHIPSEKITVIKGGRDAGRLGRPSAQRRRQARIRLGLEDHQEVLVNVGRQDYQKGQRYLIEAMARLVRTRSTRILLIAGQAGNVSPDLNSLCDHLRLGEKVRFLGHREDVPDILAAADLFVFPSLYEGLPGAVVEAMALGLPIVASDIDPVRETVEEGRNAVLVKPGSPMELASAIERLLDDRQTALTFGMRSREIYDERFTIEQSMIRLMAFYQEVVSVNQAGSLAKRYT